MRITTRVLRTLARHLRRAAACATMALLTVASSLAQAETRPVWELGLGLGVLSVPFYRGADEGRSYLIPVPYIIYRSRYLQVDEEGLRGKLFRSDRLLLDLSVAGGVPVPENADGPRAGMAKLSPTVEIGPQLEYELWRADDRHAALWLHLPVRSALSVNWGEFQDQGWVFSPYVEYQTPDGGRGGPWGKSIGIGPLFADRRYHDYFYEVTGAEARPGRPEYHPDAGYSGSRVTLTLHKRIERWWFGAFVRVDHLDGAVFADSPLVRNDWYYAAGAAVARLFATSRDRVEYTGTAK